MILYLTCVVHFAFTFMFYFSSFARRCVMPCKLLSVLVSRKFNRKKSFAKCFAVNRFRVNWTRYSTQPLNTFIISLECRWYVSGILLYFAIVFVSSTSSSFSPYSLSLRLSSAKRRTIHTWQRFCFVATQRILTGGIMCKITAVARAGYGCAFEHIFHADCARQFHSLGE